jgi:hypothetical protein
VGQLPPLEDDTLCHFANGAFVASYAVPAFEASSYQKMFAAACLSPNECWFAGAPLPADQPGAFELHWNGTSLLAEPNEHVSEIRSLAASEGRLLEGFPIPEILEEEEIEHPALLRAIEPGPEGSTTFAPVKMEGESGQALPEYAAGSFPRALGFLHVSAVEGALWAAAEAAETPPPGSEPGALTVLRESVGRWKQLLGPVGTESAQTDPEDVAHESVISLAAEPPGEAGWVALDTLEDSHRPSPTALARLLRVQADGTSTEELLPSEAEQAQGTGGRGAASRIVCPAEDDCWMATTQGWLFHLAPAGERTLPKDEDPAFNGPLITTRPADEGLPVVPSTNEEEETANETTKETGKTKTPEKQRFAEVTLPLLSHLRSRLIHGTTLELSFHLAVKAKVRLLAERHKHVVAATPLRTLRAGKRSLLVRLNPAKWPTKLNLKTKALGPLPKVSTQESSVGTVSTSLLGRSPFAELGSSL